MKSLVKSEIIWDQADKLFTSIREQISGLSHELLVVVMQPLRHQITHEFKNRIILEDNDAV